MAMLKSSGQKLLPVGRTVMRTGVRRCTQGSAPPPPFPPPPQGRPQGWGGPSGWYNWYMYHCGPPRYQGPGFIKITLGVATGVVIGNTLSGNKRQQRFYYHCTDDDCENLKNQCKDSMGDNPSFTVAFSCSDWNKDRCGGADKRKGGRKRRAKTEQDLSDDEESLNSD